MIFRYVGIYSKKFEYFSNSKNSIHREIDLSKFFNDNSKGRRRNEIVIVRKRRERFLANIKG